MSLPEQENHIFGNTEASSLHLSQFSSSGIHVVSDPWSSSRGKCCFSTQLAHQKECQSTNLAVILKVCMENLIEC